MSSLNPQYSTKSFKQDKADKFSHSYIALHSKNPGQPKKNGAGGAHTWGSYKDDLIHQEQAEIDAREYANNQH